MLITLAGILTRALLLQTPVSSLRHHTRPVFDLPGVRMASKRSIISDFFAPKKAAKSEMTTTATASSTSSPRKPMTASIDPETAAKIAAKREEARQKLAAKGVVSKASSSLSGGSMGVVIPPLPPSWEAVIGSERHKKYFKDLENFLAGEARKGKKIFPPSNEVFSALDQCAFDNVRVVIIGQDPYHNTGQGHGLAFSVKHGVQTPPSLRNMIDEAIACGFMKSRPNHGNLSHWSSQGVLLLNNVLTVEAHKANSHQKKGWETFTDAIVQALNKRPGPGIVFLLWGKPAQTKGKSIDRRKHHVITSSHPSPLGYTKTNEPFKGSRCFLRANEWLVKSEHAAVDWSVK